MQRNEHGWFGTMREVSNYLHVIGADRDDEGRFLIEGSVSSFMGSTDENADVVVSGDTCYFVDGERKNLSAGLRSTSHGLGVAVIDGS